jgi:hypothetical protein
MRVVVHLLILLTVSCRSPSYTERHETVSNREREMIGFEKQKRDAIINTAGIHYP